MLTFKEYGDTGFLTGMRAYAALAVVLTHAGGGGLRELGGIVTNLVDLGGQGVAVFFVISGYSVAASYLKSEGFLDYINKRFWRIAPLYYFWILVACIAGGTAISWQVTNNVEIDFYNILMHVTFLSSLDYKIAPTLLGVDWTLSIEMIWYFIVPLLLFFVRGMLSIVVLITVSYYIFKYTLLGVTLLFPAFDADSQHWIVHWSPVQYILGFALGIAAYRLREMSLGLSRFGDVMFGVLLLSLAVYLTLPMDILHKESYRFFTIVSFLLILFGSAENYFIRKVFMNHLVMIIGTLSYGIYLSHAVILGLLGDIINDDLTVKLLVVLSLAFMVSVLTYVTIERRGLITGKLFYHRFKKKEV